MTMPTSVETRRFETEALALDAMRQGDLTRAKVIAEGLLRLVWEDSIEDAVIRRCLLRLVDRDEPVTVPCPGQDASWSDRTFYQVALAWCLWADGNPEAVRKALQVVHSPDVDRTTSPLTHRMALDDWAGAIDRLLDGNFIQAGRLWRSSIDLSSQFGLPMLPAIQWSYLVSR